MKSKINKTNNNTSNSLYPQGTLVCPVCNKGFQANDDTRYIISGGYTCSWKCFLNESKRRDSLRQKDNNNKNKKNKKINI